VAVQGDGGILGFAFAAVPNLNQGFRGFAGGFDSVQDEVVVVDVSHADVTVHADLVRGLPSMPDHHLGVREAFRVVGATRMVEHVRIDLPVQGPPP